MTDVEKAWSGMHAKTAYCHCFSDYDHTDHDHKVIVIYEGNNIACSTLTTATVVMGRNYVSYGQFRSIFEHRTLLTTLWHRLG